MQFESIYSATIYGRGTGFILMWEVVELCMTEDTNGTPMADSVIHKVKWVLFDKIILNEECKVGLIGIVYLYYTSVVLVKYKYLDVDYNNKFISWFAL
jgi:hypothetical protein